MNSDREDDAIGAAAAMAEATDRLRSSGWMISAVTQPIIPAEMTSPDAPADAPAPLSAS